MAIESVSSEDTAHLEKLIKGQKSHGQGAAMRPIQLPTNATTRSKSFAGSRVAPIAAAINRRQMPAVTPAFQAAKQAPAKSTISSRFPCNSAIPKNQVTTDSFCFIESHYLTQLCRFAGRCN